MSSSTTNAVNTPAQPLPAPAGGNDPKLASATKPGQPDPPQGSSSQKLAGKPATNINQLGPGPQQPTGLRVSGSTELHGAAEIWTGRNANGLYAYLVTRTISVPLGRITEQSLAQAKQGATPLNRSQDFYGLAKSLMADPGISGRDYAAGNVEIVADWPVTQAEVTANDRVLGRTPTYNMRVHDVMRQAGLAPDPRDGRTYTLPATRLGGQLAAKIFLDEPPGQRGALNGLADADRLFPNAPKDFIDGFNGVKTGVTAMKVIGGLQFGVSLLAAKGAAHVWGAKIQGRVPQLNTSLRVPGAQTVARLTSNVVNNVLPAPRTAGLQSKPTTPPPTKTLVSERPTTGNNGLRPPSGGNPSPPSGNVLPKAAQSSYFDRNPGGLGFGQTPSSGSLFSPGTPNDTPGLSASNGFDQYAQRVSEETKQLSEVLQRQKDQNNAPGSAYPSTQAPQPQAPVIKPGEPARIGGVNAKVLGDGGNLQATYVQATVQTRNYNNVRGADVSLVYPVKDQGVQRLHVIQGISPSEARTLLYQLDQRGELALPRKDVFFHNGIGGRRGDGSVVTPEQDLQRREADLFFSKLTSQQITAKVQGNTLTINGKQGVALNASQWKEASRLYTQANAPERGMVSLALQRQHTLQGPHGQTRQVPVVEAWADLTPEEARALLNRAAGFNTKGERTFTPSLINPDGNPNKDAIGPTLKANGLSPDGLHQRSKTLYQQQHPSSATTKPHTTQAEPTSGAPGANNELSALLKRPLFVIPGGDVYAQLDKNGVQRSLTPDDVKWLKDSGKNAAMLSPPGGLSPDSALVRWASGYPSSQLGGVLRSNPDIVRDAKLLEQQGWTFDWMPRVERQLYQPPPAQIMAAEKKIMIDGGMASENTWPKTLELGLRDGIRQAQIVTNGVENDVSWLAFQRGPLDQTAINTSSIARFGFDSSNRVLFDSPIQRELKAAAQQAWVSQRPVDTAFALPETTVTKLDSVSATARGQDGTIPDYLIRMTDSGSGEQYYRATAERVSSRTDAQGHSTITWRLEASSSHGEVQVPTVSFVTGGPAATPQRSPFDRETIAYRSNFDVDTLKNTLRAGLARAFPWRADQIATATLEPVPGSAERTVPADSVFGTWGIGNNRSDGAPNHSTVELPAATWKLSMNDRGMNHDYVVRVTSFNHSGGQINFDVTPDPLSRARQTPLSPVGTQPISSQTLNRNQQYVDKASQGQLRGLGQLQRSLTALDPKIQLELLNSGQVDDWLAKMASNPVLNTVPYIVTPDSIESIVKQETAGDKRVLVLYSGNAAADLSAFDNDRDPNVRLERAPAESTGEALQAVLNRGDIASFDKVIAVGGGTVKDLAAMAVAVGTDYDGLHANTASAAGVRQELQRLGIALQRDGGRRYMKAGIELITIPTQLAQTGNTTPFAVLKTRDDGFIMSTRHPDRTHIALTKLTATNERWTEEKLRQSFVSGAADYAAGLSYASAKALQEGIPVQQAIQTYAPEAARVYDWFVDNLPRAQSNFSSEAAQILSYAFQEYSTNRQPLLADEHNFFDIIDKYRPEGRGPWPSHGEWVAVGTVLNLYVYGKQTGDFSLYEKVRNDYQRLGAPVDLASLQRQGVTSDHLIRALGTLRTKDYSGSPRPPLLRDYVKTHDPSQLINEALRSR